MERKLPWAIAVDFDGTLCENCWPEIGEANEELIDWLVGWRKQGNKLILWTNRCGKTLEQAVEWCKDRGLEFDTVNENLPERVEFFGDDPRKVSADYYSDDESAVLYQIGPRPQVIFP